MHSLVVLAGSIVLLGVLVLLLRWTYGTGKSLVARPPRTGTPQEYGLLIPVAAPADRAEGERLAARLTAAGVRHTLAPTSDGLRLMVWPGDEEAARRALRR